MPPPNTTATLTSAFYPAGPVNKRLLVKHLTVLDFVFLLYEGPCICFHFKTVIHPCWVAYGHGFLDCCIVGGRQDCLLPLLPFFRIYSAEWDICTVHGLHPHTQLLETIFSFLYVSASIVCACQFHLCIQGSHCCSGFFFFLFLLI